MFYTVQIIIILNYESRIKTILKLSLFYLLAIPFIPVVFFWRGKNLMPADYGEFSEVYKHLYSRPEFCCCWWWSNYAQCQVKHLKYLKNFHDICMHYVNCLQNVFTVTKPQLIIVFDAFIVPNYVKISYAAYFHRVRDFSHYCGLWQSRVTSG